MRYHIYEQVDEDSILLGVLEHDDKVDVNKLYAIWELEQVGPEPATDLNKLAETQHNWAKYRRKKQVLEKRNFINYLLEKRNFRLVQPETYDVVYL